MLFERILQHGKDSYRVWQWFLHSPNYNSWPCKAWGLMALGLRVWLICLVQIGHMDTPLPACLFVAWLVYNFLERGWFSSWSYIGSSACDLKARLCLIAELRHCCEVSVSGPVCPGLTAWPWQGRISDAWWWQTLLTHLVFWTLLQQMSPWP